MWSNDTRKPEISDDVTLTEKMRSVQYEGSRYEACPRSRGRKDADAQDYYVWVTLHVGIFTSTTSRTSFVLWGL